MEDIFAILLLITLRSVYEKTEKALLVMTESVRYVSRYNGYHGNYEEAYRLKEEIQIFTGAERIKRRLNNSEIHRKCHSENEIKNTECRFEPVGTAKHINSHKDNGYTGYNKIDHVGIKGDAKSFKGLLFRSARINSYLIFSPLFPHHSVDES